MIDKASEKWQNVPWWVSCSLLGLKERKQAIISVILLLVCGAAFYLNNGWGNTSNFGAFIWLGMYLLAVGWFAMAIKWVDKKGMW